MGRGCVVQTARRTRPPAGSGDRSLLAPAKRRRHSPLLCRKQGTKGYLCALRISAAVLAALVPTAAYSDSAFPTTFLDIAGTYVNQLFDAHCASFRPPPNVLTLELAAVEQIDEGRGQRLTYRGTLDHYDSPVIRPDCATIDREVACGWQPLVDGRCGLEGNRLTVSGALDWHVQGSTVTWGIPQEFSAVREPGVEGPLPGGVQGPYFHTDAIRFFMMNGYGFGARADLGEVTQLGIELSVQAASGGPEAICTCQARSPDDRVFCCVGNPLFRKVASNAAQLDAFANIEGTLRSSLPTLTQTDREVHRARLRLLRQNEGHIRAQMPGEDDQAYAAYLATKTFTPVAEITIERNSGGADTFGSPGRFVLENVRLFQAADRGARHVWEPAQYTIEVRAAQTDELVIDPDTMQPIEGKTTPLYFAPTDVRNVFPGAASLGEIELVPFIALEAKQSLVDRLSARCAVNYGPTEQGAAAYLEQLRSGTLETTPEREEGLKRAIWAERAINGSAALASELLDLSLTGLGTLLADAFADLTDFSSAKLTAAKKRLDRINATPASAVPPAFNAAKLRAAEKKAAANAQRIVDDADLADSMKATVKALKPLVELALVKAGVGPARAASIAGNYTLVVATIFSAIQTGTLRGGAVPLIKKAIEEAVKQVKPLMLDGVDTVAFSYCQSTRDTLSFSVDRMQTWNTSNDAALRAHRGNVVATMTSMNDEASQTIAAVGALLEAASGLDTVQDAASVIGKGVKWVKVVEGAANVMKYGFNANAAVTPLVVIYSAVNDFANKAAYQAFGELPPAIVSTGQSVTGDRRDRVPPGRFADRRSSYTANARLTLHDAQPMLTALAGLRAALAADDIGTAAEILTDRAAGSYLAERDAWTASVRAFLVQALAVDPALADAQLGEAIAQTYIEQIELFRLEAELDDVLTDLFEQVLTGEYTSATDPFYVARRGQVLTYVDVVIDQVGMLTNALDLLGFELDGGLQFQPAVLVDSVTVTSDSSGESAVTATPETFTVRARLRNVSDRAVTNVGARLRVVSPSGAAAALDAAVSAIGSLAADDGVDGTGTDEAEVAWRVRYQGDFSPELIVLDVEVVESGAEPTTFFATGSQALLPLDPSVGDTDLDTLPDGYETAHGLDTTRDDAQDDPDGDGLSNRAEYELGTSPAQPDSDGDGASDGDETLGVDGFTTDPLDPDTDDDGTPDGSDGAPIDGSSTATPPPAPEPIVAVSATTVRLSSANRIALVTVTNAGAGTLEWSASAEDAALIRTSPALPDRRPQGTHLSITAPGSFDFTSSGNFQTRVLVADVSGAVRDSVEIVVNVVGDAAIGFCARPTAVSPNEPITASDALFALKAAVGSITCELCRCDIDGSGTLTASDALRILRKAVGVDVPLDCPAC